MKVKSTLRVIDQANLKGHVGVIPGQSMKRLVGCPEVPTDRVRVGLATYAPGSIEELHWHPIESYYFVISGHATVRNFEGEEFEVGPGCSIYAPPGIAGAHEWEVKEALQILAVRATTESNKKMQFTVDKETSAHISTWTSSQNATVSASSRITEMPFGKSLLPALLLFAVGSVTAQSYPNKPIRIVTTEAGSGTDFGARLVAQGISGALGQQVVVENRSGVMPNEVVFRAAADGYTLLLNGSAHWLLPFLQADLAWQPLKDFTPVTMTDRSPNVLVVQPGFAAKSVLELIALAKAKPGEYNYARAAPGGPPHLSAELFKSLAGINLVAIPFKGGGPAVIGLMSGQAHVMFATAATVVQHIKSGKLRGLAITTVQPSALLPELPTMTNAGVPGFESSAIFGIFCARGNTGRNNRSVESRDRAVSRQTRRETEISDCGRRAGGSTPDQFAATIRSEMAKWGKLMKDVGIRAE